MKYKIVGMLSFMTVGLCHSCNFLDTEPLAQYSEMTISESEGPQYTTKSSAMRRAGICATSILRATPR